jgi:hypothetical protein
MMASGLVPRVSFQGGAVGYGKGRATERNQSAAPEDAQRARHRLTRGPDELANLSMRE